MTVDHVGLAVNDLDRMTRWWCVALDASIEYSVHRPAIAMRANVLLDGDGFRLELLHRDGSRSGHARWDIGESLLVHGYGHLALRVHDVSETFRRLVQHGAAPVMQPGPGTQPGMTIAFVADPEDNLIELLSR